MTRHKSNMEFCQLLDELGWSDGRCSISLGTSASTIKAWKEGLHPVPDRFMRMLRKHYEIAHPGARPANTPPPPSMHGSSNPHIDEPHMNWHEPASSEARFRENYHTGVHSPLPESEAARLQERVHTLEEQLLRLRRSYRELSSENERLRAKLGESNTFGPYAVLGVEPGTDWAEIKRVYIRLSQENHPDRGGDIEKMQEITEAYTELKLVYA